MDKYLENGQEIFTTFCSTSEKRPVMLPRAPEQTYIDLYPDTDRTPFTADIQRQSNYEAEVMVYRALERLEEELIVLHNFEYTHHQYRLCDNKHIRKGCSKCKGKNAGNKEGECDFLVVCSNFFVIIEVKDMHHLGLVDVEIQAYDPESSASKQLGALNGTFHKSLAQRKRMSELIKCIDKNAEVLHFTAYPNFSKEYKKEFQLSEEELNSIIFKEDLIDVSTKENSEFSFPVADVWEVESSSQVSPSRSEYVHKKKSYISIEKSAMVYGDEDDLMIDDIFEADVREGDFPRAGSDEISEDESSCEEFTPTSDDSISDEDEPDLKINSVSQSFNAWWRSHVASATRKDDHEKERTDNHIKARNMLLAMWCTDKDKFVRDKCSLARCVVDIDKKLKSGQFSFRKTNPSVLPAPNVIKDYVGVMNLTVQQHQLSTSSENLLWINGPAGSGKTVLICGKIIEIAKYDTQERILLFLFGGNKSEGTMHEDALRKSDVEYSLINEVSEETHPPPELASMLTDSGLSKVVIIQITGHTTLTWLTESLQLLQDFHVFIDDIQVVMECDVGVQQYDAMIKLMIQIAVNRKVHVACDIAQFWFANDDRDIFHLAGCLKQQLKSSQLGSLSKNLRNPCDLSRILSILRSRFIEYFSGPGLTTRSLDAIDIILPKQIAGHYIHGPKTKVHVLKDGDFNQIRDILFQELGELCSTDALGNSDISIVCDNLDPDFITKISEQVNKRCDKTNKIWEAGDCLSAEWPVVIILQERRSAMNKKPDNLVSLYLQISRARVCCSVILFPEQGKKLTSRGMFGILEGLADCAHIYIH
ncbi:hypothetical protein ACHWQZ_G008463 [Mnemiopsis leidyi]